MKAKIVYTLIVAGAFGSGLYLGAGQVEKQTSDKRIDQEVKVVEKIVEKIVTVTEKPDGTKVTRTEDKVSDKQKDGVKSKTKSETKQKPVYKPQYSVGVSGSVYGPDLTTYTVDVKRRVFGNLWGGVYVRSDFSSVPELGIGLRMDF